MINIKLIINIMNNPLTINNNYDDDNINNHNNINFNNNTQDDINNDNNNCNNI